MPVILSSAPQINMPATFYMYFPLYWYCILYTEPILLYTSFTKQQTATLILHNTTIYKQVANMPIRCQTCHIMLIISHAYMGGIYIKSPHIYCANCSSTYCHVPLTNIPVTFYICPTVVLLYSTYRGHNTLHLTHQTIKCKIYFKCYCLIHTSYKYAHQMPYMSHMQIISLAYIHGI